MAARLAERLTPLRAIPAAESALQVAARTSITARPRTDPYERTYRIRLLPWMRAPSAHPDKDEEYVGEESTVRR
jgi:hypothetical protein